MRPPTLCISPGQAVTTIASVKSHKPGRVVSELERDRCRLIVSLDKFMPAHTGQGSDQSLLIYMVSDSALG